MDKIELCAYAIAYFISFIPLIVYIIFSLFIGYNDVPFIFGVFTIIVNVLWIMFLKSYGISKKSISKKQKDDISYIG